MLLRSACTRFIMPHRVETGQVNIPMVPDLDDLEWRSETAGVAWLQPKKCQLEQRAVAEESLYQSPRGSGVSSSIALARLSYSSRRDALSPPYLPSPELSSPPRDHFSSALSPRFRCPVPRLPLREVRTTSRSQRLTPVLPMLP